MSSILGTIGSRLGAVGGAAVGFGVGHGVSPAIRPVVQDLANEAWQAHRVRPLDAGLAAALVAQGFWPQARGLEEASMSGFDDARFAGLVREASSGVTLEQALELARRAIIDGATFAEALEQVGIRPEWRTPLAELLERVLSVENAASLAARGIIDEARARSIAEQNGYRGADFEALVRAAYHPPSAEELLALWNRGEASESEVDGALELAGVAPEWRDAFKALRDYLPPVSDQVRFAVREVFSPDIRSRYRLDEDFPAEFAAEARKLGLSDEWARAYWAAHWELPSIEQGYRMFHRRIMSREDLETLLRTKDVMPYWRDKLIDNAYLVPGRIDLRRMFRFGTIDRARLVDGYLDLGYNPETAELLAQFTEDEAEDAGTRGSLLPAYRRRVVQAAAREYIARQIDEGEARRVLGELGIRAEVVNGLFPLWNLERELVRRELTVAEIIKAAKGGQLTRDEALAELRERGMSERDATVKLESNA